MKTKGHELGETTASKAHDEVAAINEGNDKAKPRAAKGDEPPQTKHHSPFVLFENFDYDQACGQNDDQKNAN